jgi:hypothetical protein
MSQPESSSSAPATTANRQPLVSPEKNRSTAWTITVFFGVLILIPSLIGFVMKFTEFISVAEGTGGGQFAITPIVNYLLASAGFFFLLMWAAFNGMFKDLEHPKFVMLETEKELDAHV